MSPSIECRVSQLEGDVRVLKTSIDNLAKTLNELTFILKWLIGISITTLLGAVGYLLTRYVL